MTAPRSALPLDARALPDRDRAAVSARYRPQAGRRGSPGRLARLALIPAVTVVLAGLAACAGVPATHFYTLVPPATAPGAGNPVASQPDDLTGPSVVIGPIAVPEAVDRPQIVVRTGANALQLLDQQRWTQSLPREIDQALLAQLARRVPNARLSSQGQSAAADAQWRLTLDVQRFDVEPQRQTVFEAIWSLRDRQGRLRDSGRFVDQRAVDQAGYDALAASQAESIARLAELLAGRLRALPAASDAAPSAAR